MHAVYYCGYIIIIVIIIIIIVIIIIIIRYMALCVTGCLTTHGLLYDLYFICHFLYIIWKRIIKIYFQNFHALFSVDFYGTFAINYELLFSGQATSNKQTLDMTVVSIRTFFLQNFNQPFRNPVTSSSEHTFQFYCEKYSTKSHAYKNYRHFNPTVQIVKTSSNLLHLVTLLIEFLTPM
jgi:hypothetical protein